MKARDHWQRSYSSARRAANEQQQSEYKAVVTVNGDDVAIKFDRFLDKVEIDRERCDDALAARLLGMNSLHLGIEDRCSESVLAARRSLNRARRAGWRLP